MGHRQAHRQGGAAGAGTERDGAGRSLAVARQAGRLEADGPGEKVALERACGRAFPERRPGRRDRGESEPSQCFVFWCSAAECFSAQGLPFASGTGQT